MSGLHVFRGETSIPYESSLERDYLIRLDFLPGVLDVIPQPVAIEFKTPQGRSFAYTPDYLVYFRLGDLNYLDYPKPLLVEVKPQSEWRSHWREWLPKWKAAYRYALEQGWQFRIMDESRIRDLALENIQFLSRYRRMQFAPEDCMQVLETLRRAESTTIDYLLGRHFVGPWRAEGIALVWHLIAMHRIDCDISRPLNDATEVWIGEHG
ncbi:TnsA endonuclease N-terminal domain-containing protein [Labrys sp. ZIDIC5]|uniref:TnsA endonuclease N-terminal domain-containing protein n=1 Tax=Labrys sedimenti TaxID=3106036 RepID=UPI002AC9F428|nr:TnsA endonuclease N-terminal domain-containing protein [Labrys sp. ZIDIC5]MDZ5453909.1 TnsA endonuclease N-terminal domain-containing protein [Labrys sp. ZIDIC5]